MRLYTAGSSKANRQACRELGVGLMMCDGWRDPSEYPFFAVDNGAFAAWKQGRRWNPATFLHILTRCAEEGKMPDFAVLPDIVGGGEESLRLSMAWSEALRATFPGFRWALAVQDGMEPETVMRIAGAWGGDLEQVLDDLRRRDDGVEARDDGSVGQVRPRERLRMPRRAHRDRREDAGGRHFWRGQHRQHHMDPAQRMP